MAPPPPPPPPPLHFPCFSNKTRPREATHHTNEPLRASASTANNSSSTLVGSTLERKMRQVTSVKGGIDTSDRLARLRKLMKWDGLDYYVIPSEDAHNSENVAASEKRREWVSGFSGSTGQAIVSKTAAYLVTNSRYWLQAREELDSNWYIIPAGTIDAPKDWIDWLVAHVEDSEIGIDAGMISHENATRLVVELNTKRSKLVFPPQNFVDLCWKDKPPRSKDPIFVQFLDFSGQEASSRLAEMRQRIRSQLPAMSIDPNSSSTASQIHVGVFITSLSSVAYLLNLGGSDIPFNPLFYAYLFVSLDKVILFLDVAKLTNDTEGYLRSLNVETREYNDIWPFLRRREWGEGKLLLYPETSYAISLMLTHFCYTIVPPYFGDIKIVKSQVEVDGLQHAYLRDLRETLEKEGRIAFTIQCFQRRRRKLRDGASIRDERADWKVGFQREYKEKLEKLGNIAMDSQNYNKAAEYFSTLLLFDMVDRKEILIKRSKAWVFMKLWDKALGDADEVIKLDPSSHQGYKRRHVALHGAKRYAEAVEAHYKMLSILDESSDGRSCDIRRWYVDATPTIRDIIQQTIRHMPRVLIDTTTGRLSDKRQQAEAFELLPIFSKLISSMTTKLDDARIWEAVKRFYRYVMFSHTWQLIEPTFQLVEKTSVYGLWSSPGNIKLQKFCGLAWSFRFNWAWSDTCCINQLDKTVQQESLVAMFRWYRGSSLTVVHLLGVSSRTQKFGCLWKSIWNTRGWTYQEYVASKVVQFYTEDWHPYLGLDILNHKESPAVLSEMERAMNFMTQELATIRPGLDRVREKLYLASMRQTTREEDIAYSLFGIFNIAIPVIYGEGNQAVGRLLEHVLTGSGDATILAWTGNVGSYNSCLPADLTVYNKIVPQHIPPSVEPTKMDGIVSELRSSLPNLSLLMRLYGRLQELPLPSLTASRLRLPGIVFRLTELVKTADQDPVTNQHIYHTTTPAFGNIEIKTKVDMSGKKDLCLVHPWIRPLLDQEFSNGVGLLDETTQALRFVARLRQPFGALLFEPVSRVEYRRVAADSLIMIQLRERVSLSELICGIRTIDIQ